MWVEKIPLIFFAHLHRPIRSSNGMIIHTRTQEPCMMNVYVTCQGDTETALEGVRSLAESAVLSFSVRVGTGTVLNATGSGFEPDAFFVSVKSSTYNLRPSKLSYRGSKILQTCHNQKQCAIRVLYSRIERLEYCDNHTFVTPYTEYQVGEERITMLTSMVRRYRESNQRLADPP